MRDGPGDGLWDAASRWVEAQIGLHFPPGQWLDLQRGLDAAAVRLGLSHARACAERLVQGACGAAEREVLADCLGVRETYFFRDPLLFDQLAQQVLAPLAAARRASTRELRLWSAGCATGEEPYSLAMLVANLLPDWRDWRMTILATDLNAGALERARAGVYGPWSLRGGMPEAAAGWLRPRPGGLHEVHPGLRERVRFEPLNLVTDRAFPAAAAAMDLIVCRNVLMYFAPARRAAVLQRLREALAEGGWLVTNPVEIPAGGVPGMTVAMSGGLIALRRAAPPAVEKPEPLPASRPRRRSPPAAAAASALRIEAAEPAASTRQAAQQPAPAADDEETRCRAAMANDKLDPQWPYLLSCILSERGAIDEAITALQRALFLAPDHVLSRFALGSIAARQGKVAASERHFAAARAHLESLPKEEVIAGSGGVTAGELERVIRLRDGGV